ncbi:MAG: hypothetical protein Kow0092_28320 [Deferrisomatales bacterium]
MTVGLVCYSRTGVTEAAARRAEELLEEAGHGVRWGPLRPRVDLPYPLWLALSFLPGSRFPLAPPLPDPAGWDACLLALPKWTFSCPPVNAYLARRPPLPPTAVLVTCGGWDQERYLAQVEKHLARRGVEVLGGLALKRRSLEGGRTPPALAEFVRRCFPAADARREEAGTTPSR